MKLISAFTLIILSCICCFSIASAQMEITTISRWVSSQILDLDDNTEDPFMYADSELLGQFQGEAQLAAHSIETNASQTSMATSGEDQLGISGHLALDLSRTEPGAEYGMQGACSVEASFTVEANSNYLMSGNITGDRSIEILFYNQASGPALVDEWIGNTDYDFSGQLVPGDYYIRWFLADTIYGSDSQEENSESNFDFLVIKDGIVATQSISLAGIKALYR